MTMLFGKIKENKNCPNIKKTAPIFLFLEGKMYQNQYFCFHFYATVFLKQYLR